MLMKIAALLTRISIRPNDFTASAAIRFVSSSLETSILSASARPPCEQISSATVSPSRISAMTTAAPSAASLRQYAAPIWRAPPVTIATRPSSLTPPLLGVMEYWSVGVMGLNPNTPLLHHSNSPIFSFQTLQVRLEVQRMPPWLHSQGLRDHPRGVVSRRAGDITAGMARRTAHK